ncbi:MAG: hypothetical protein DBY23_06710 [Bacillota bacterium]|nr:MAG: hypothetical protein DBY23_06710 [Bacillota bacterium]
MNNKNEGNSLKMILDYIKKIPSFVKLGCTTSCLPFLGCFAIVLAILFVIISITGMVFEWTVSISDGSGTLSETLGNFFDGNGWLTDEEYRDEQERKYYQKLADVYEKYNSEAFDNIKINTSLITATLFYNKAGGDLQDDYISPSCDPSSDTDDCAVNSDEEMGDFYRNARGYIYTLAKYMVVYNRPETHCNNYCDPNSPYYPGGPLPTECTEGLITTTPGTIRYDPDGSGILPECANENQANNGILSEECQSAAARELAEKPWEWGDNTQGLFEGYTTRDIYTTYQANVDANGNALSYPVCMYDNMSQKERDEIENLCVNNSLYRSISSLYGRFVNIGCESADEDERPSSCNSLQSQISQKESSLQSGTKFGEFISIGHNGSSGTSCDFTCPSSFDVSNGSECQQEEVEGYYSVEWKKYQVYYYKLMTRPKSFLNIGKEESFIEDYYHDYIETSENATEEEKEETIVEIADGIYDLLYSIIGSEEEYEMYVAGSGPGGYITSYIPGDSGPWQTWTQFGQPWSSISLGGSSATISSHGCLVTSIAIQIARSGLWPGEFDPGVLVTQLNATGGFSSGGALQWGPLRAALPAGMTMECDTRDGTCPATIEYISQSVSAGKYVVLRAKVNQHWVAVDYVSGNDIYVYDPGVTHTTSLPLSQISSSYDGLSNLRFLVFSVSG